MPGDSLNININTKGVAANTFEAIVIGSGISGGWSAKELCEHGIKTLLLERGRNVVHKKDYPTALKGPWEFTHRGRLPIAIEKENPVVSKCYAFDETAQHVFVKDKEHPYIQEKPFDWIRGYQVGGKSLMWARETQRWSRFEFEAPGRDGYAVEWPITYDDLAPWYSHVEKFAGISGNKDGIENLPDGEFLPPWEFNCVEKMMRDKVNAHYSDRRMLMGRCANLSKAGELQLLQNRGQCQARNLCMRGCPFGGYFSSNSSTLPWAEKTGNLTVRPFSVAHSIIYDEHQQKASGVRVIDTNTKQLTDFFARIIFVNGSALNSNLILLNSTSNRFPNGLGNDSGILGKYVCYHNYRGSMNGLMEGFEDKYIYGRNPTDAIIANYRNLHKIDTDFVGGYTTYMGAYRDRHDGDRCPEQIGAVYKEAMTEPGQWHVYAYLQGETVPKEANHV